MRIELDKLVERFIGRWAAASASERSNSQLFLSELCAVLSLTPPDPSLENGYAFEFPVIDRHMDGTTTERRIDLYKRGCFVLESKQFQAPKDAPSDLQLAAEAAGTVSRKKKSAPVRGTDRWDDAMFKARGQAERYIRTLPDSEPNPPFLLVVDVGDTFEVFADFTQAGKAYLPFPDPRGFRIRLPDLRRSEIRERLCLIWTNPLALDPSRESAAVTREVAGHLAELARSFEGSGHSAQTVAEFLSRCLFCMFAEDVGLLPERSFTDLLESIPDSGEGFVPLVSQLFREMDKGTGREISVILRKKLLCFNGGLFADDTVLPVNKLQLGLLRLAALQQWKNVEPAIFGTLLERALNPHERHKLGAHYTPRAYVERLVLPTVIEPVREEWEHVRGAALTLARAGKLDAARTEIHDFHRRLCELKVLDPACGSGNFLYVTLEHLKRLEGEVLDVGASFGESMMLELSDRTVDPHQFLGIEVNPRAAAITELVLWIGYLQWHFRTRGQTMPAEPVLKKFRNIECRDAVLIWDGVPQPALDEAGKMITVWDRQTFKLDALTGRTVPDETKRIPLWRYVNSRPSDWPTADYIVGNPPFLGTKRMREALGDGYVEALRATYAEVVEDNADFVMLWWHKAAQLARENRVRRFGFITTNSIAHAFNRRVVQAHLSANSPLSLLFAVPDHPWVESSDGASVRIAMTVGVAGTHSGELSQLVQESPQPDGSAVVTLAVSRGRIHADLTLGADVGSAQALIANEGICGFGVALHGAGFILTPAQAEAFRQHGAAVIKPYMGGSDLVREPRERYLVDFSFMDEGEARAANIKAFQHIIDHVRPERLVNRRESIKRLWWRYGWERPELRKAMTGLARYIATTETAKHRIFQFLDGDILPDHMVIVIASDDAFYLGILSSRIHVLYSLAAGGRLGVGNDPRYNKTRCFDPFPFPVCSETQRQTVSKLAEELDAHRKRAQAAQRGVTLTGMYNVLEKLRAGQPLSLKEKQIHDAGLVSVLKQLHNDLDAAVFEAYGWPRNLSDAEILERVVALNAERLREESLGCIRWLRPEYQTAKTTAAVTPDLLPSEEIARVTRGKRQPSSREVFVPKTKKQPWPKTLAERVKAVSEGLRSAPAATTSAELAKSFTRAKPSDVAEILETLCTMGLAHRGKERETFLP